MIRKGVKEKTGVETTHEGLLLVLSCSGIGSSTAYVSDLENLWVFLTKWVKR